jgi:signal transduction histidine kinase
MTRRPSGTGPGPSRVSGFVNMSDRFGAIGGTVEGDATPGRGTRVSGAVPVDGHERGQGG